MMEFEELVSLRAQQDRVVWNAAFRVFCLAESCHREQVLSKQHEQGFELEKEKGLDNIVIVACLLKNCSVVHKKVIKKTRKIHKYIWVSFKTTQCKSVLIWVKFEQRLLGHCGHWIFTSFKAIALD